MLHVIHSRVTYSSVSDERTCRRQLTIQRVDSGQPRIAPFFADMILMMTMMIATTVMMMAMIMMMMMTTTTTMAFCLQVCRLESKDRDDGLQSPSLTNRVQGIRHVFTPPLSVTVGSQGNGYVTAPWLIASWLQVLHRKIVKKGKHLSS